MFGDDSSHVSDKIFEIFGEDGTGKAVGDLLSGNIDIESIGLEDESYNTWLKILQMSPSERALDMANIEISPAEFKAIFKEASKKEVPNLRWATIHTVKSSC